MSLPAGVIPAVLLPFHDDLSIDEGSYRAHLRDVKAVEGISAITVNAHASEVASCSFDEQRRVLEISKEELARCRSSTASTPTAASRRRGSRRWRRRAALRRCSCS